MSAPIGGDRSRTRFTRTQSHQPRLFLLRIPHATEPLADRVLVRNRVCPQKPQQGLFPFQLPQIRQGHPTQHEERHQRPHKDLRFVAPVASRSRQMLCHALPKLHSLQILGVMMKSGVQGD